MNAEREARNSELKERTFGFGLRIVRLVQSLSKVGSADILGRQLLRSGTSVGANYRAGTRARSRADFIAKLGIAEEECDETIYWMDMLIELKLISAHRTRELRSEAEQLLAIIVSSIKTARRNEG
jgi:four helix bundle protein